jgi:hypothetical protein
VSNLLNSFMPTLPWWFLVLALTGLTAWVITARARLYAAKRRRIDGVRKALSDARDIMATLVADPGLTQAVRDRALASYEALTKTLSKENSTT